MTKGVFQSDPEKMELCASVKGHADTAPYGYDTVCAALSALSYVLMQCVSDAKKSGELESSFIRVKSGEVIVKCRAKDISVFCRLLTVFETVKKVMNLITE